MTEDSLDRFERVDLDAPMPSRQDLDGHYAEYEEYDVRAVAQLFID